MGWFFHHFCPLYSFLKNKNSLFFFFLPQTNPLLFFKQDENYAREIMQLFSIGVYELNMDGTNKLDDSGSPVLTYDNTDIQNFARAWTGFIRQPRRSNIEMSVWDWDNRMDPMKIQGKSKYFNILIFNSCTSSTWMVH